MITLRNQIDYCKKRIAKGDADHQQLRAIMESLILIDKLNLIPKDIDGKDYQRFVEVYFEFIRSRGTEPKMNPASGKAMKQIITYFLKIEKIDGDVEQALGAWKYILQRWDQLTEFIRKQVGLPAIYKYLEEILEELRNGNKTKKTHPQGAKTYDEPKTSFGKM